MYLDFNDFVSFQIRLRFGVSANYTVENMHFTDNCSAVMPLLKYSQYQIYLLMYSFLNLFIDAL